MHNITSKVLYWEPNSNKLRLKRIEINDARSFSHNLDEHGFELVNISTNVSEWTRDQIVGSFYDSVLDYALDVSKCDLVAIPFYFLRSSNSERFGFIQGAIRSVHSDYAPSFEHLQRKEFDTLPPHFSDFKTKTRDGYTHSKKFSEYSRCVIIQFWKNIGSPTMDFPLGFIDKSTIPEDDVFIQGTNEPDGHGGRRIFDTVLFKHNPKHGWYYFPEMTGDETVMFKTFDTENFVYAPHASFRDKRYAQERRSIECRVSCWFS